MEGGGWQHALRQGERLRQLEIAWNNPRDGVRAIQERPDDALVHANGNRRREEELLDAELAHCLAVLGEVIGLLALRPQVLLEARAVCVQRKALELVRAVLSGC